MNVFVGAVIDVEGLSSGDRGRVQSRCARTAECVADCGGNALGVPLWACGGV